MLSFILLLDTSDKESQSPRVLEPPNVEYILSRYVGMNGLFFVFPGLKPLIISDTFHDCRASSIINQDLWASTNQNWKSLSDKISWWE